MAKGKTLSVVFKANHQNQGMLFPPDLKELIAADHPVFTNIKHNHSFKRFMLRGIEKVTIETGLLALAHNLRKKTA